MSSAAKLVVFVALTRLTYCAGDEICVDNPVAWQGSDDYGCLSYELNSYCTESGGYGTGWKESWGTFEDYENDGHDATQACCHCGGGVTTTVCSDTDPPSVPFGCDQFTNRWMCQAYYYYNTAYYDTEDFTALDMCCVCGGGLTPATPTAAPTVAPTAVPGSTFLTRDAAAGDTDLHVISEEGFNVGDTIQIEGDGNDQTAVVASFGTIVIENGLIFNFPIGAAVIIVEPSCQACG